MGETLTMVIKKDKEVYIREVYTSVLKPFIDNIDLYDFKEEHLNNYLINYFSSTFVETLTLSPSNHGLIVIDINNKTILSNQGYTDFGLISTISLKSNKREIEIEDRLKRIIERKKISELYQSYPIEKSINLKNKSYDEIIKEIDENPGMEIKIDHGWNIKEYDESSESYVEMKKDIMYLGLKLNENDFEAWDEWDKEQFDQELEM